MIFKKKPVAEIHIELGEDGMASTRVKGSSRVIMETLCGTLTGLVIQLRKDSATRGEVRDMLLDAVGAHFDDQWKTQVLEGQK